jgi:hypothetical protein
MPDGPPAREATASTRKGDDGIGLNIIAKLATVLECEPAELLRISGRRREGTPERCR